MLKKLVLLGTVITLLTGCYSLKPSIMLRTPRGYKYATPPQNPAKEYKISINDVLEFRMYTNDGFKLIDLTSTTTQLSFSFTYLVEVDGTVKFPIIGHVALKGLTVREAETLLEEKYALHYVKPFVILKVTNKRVIVFPGSEGSARVILLSNENTTLLEALAIAGGISNNGKAKKIKLIRGDLKNPEVYLIDLSTIEGVKQADLVLQANDIIYVEPRADFGKTFIAEVLPYMSFITSVIVFYTFINRT
ncbi:MAG: polysaccharide biosynthesis/export family protein, partial [Bacteroidota bacterium]